MREVRPYISETVPRYQRNPYGPLGVSRRKKSTRNVRFRNPDESFSIAERFHRELTFMTPLNPSLTLFHIHHTSSSFSPPPSSTSFDRLHTRIRTIFPRPLDPARFPSTSNEKVYAEKNYILLNIVGHITRSVPLTFEISKL